MRRPHVLARNCGGEYPRDVVVVDTETDQLTLPDGTIGHVLRFGWAMFARRQQGARWSAPQWHRFTTRAEFWSWALRRCRTGARLLIYCHNAEFDAQVMDCFGELARRRWRLKSACLQGPPTIIRWRRGRRSVAWLDSLNYWPTSLDELGKRVGLGKLPMPEQNAPAEEWDRYCRRDVEVVWRSLVEWWAFLARHDLGTAAATLAAQSFNAYRHRFMDCNIFIDCNEDALELARDAYMGGRVECHTLGELPGPGALYDVNAMYPAVMRELQAPVALLTVRGRIGVDQLAAYLARYACVADVQIETELPALPARIEGKLAFPVGSWRASLTSPELGLALELGALKRVYRCAIYDRALAFSRWASWVWKMRRAALDRGDTIEAWQLKILGNAFYGKFGQRGRVWEIIAQEDRAQVRAFDSYDLDAKQWRHFRQIGRSVQELSELGESVNSHPAIAAHVTAAARVALWRFMELAGRANVHYTDTDSLIVSGDAPARLAPHVSASELGALKLEKQWTRAEVRGLKDYTLDGETKVKGVSKRAIWIDGTCAVQDQWVGWAGAIRRGRVDMPVTVPTLKVQARRYTKGQIGPTGRVEPLRLALP